MSVDWIAEDDRIAEHLAGAEAFVAARDVSHLPIAVRAVRAWLLGELRQYRRARRYPRNHLRHERTPIFVDEHGTRCAMAHLLELVGAHALVDRVATTANLAYVNDLASDPELLDWLAAMGLGVEDAARIQPSYCTATRSECWCGRYAAVTNHAVVTARVLGASDGGSTTHAEVIELRGGRGYAPGDIITYPLGAEPGSVVLLAV